MFARAPSDSSVISIRGGCSHWHWHAGARLAIRGTPYSVRRHYDAAVPRDLPLRMAHGEYDRDDGRACVRPLRVRCACVRPCVRACLDVCVVV